MNINVTLFVQMIAFAIFVWFVMRYVRPPIAKAMTDRQARIADGLAAAEKGAKSLAAAAAKSEDSLKQARTQAQEILGGASKQAVQLVEQAKGQAQVEAERIKQAAHAEVERTVAQAREQLRKEVGQLAVLGASQILKREIDEKRHADVLKELAGKV